MSGCSVCGAAAGACAHDEAPSGLELDFERGRPPPSKVAPVVAPPAPAPFTLSRPAPLPPPDSGGIVSAGLVKAVIGFAAVALVIGLVWFGVRKLKSSAEAAMDEAVTRPYSSPSRLVIASVTSDYASEALADGALVLHKAPAGASIGLAGWYTADHPPSGALEQGVAAARGKPAYRALETPEEPCRHDAETSVTTLGELSWGDADKVTLWTCTLTKKQHSYFLAYAVRSSDLDENKQRIMSMIKGSQLVSNDLCSLNVVNGGCMPSAPKLIAAIVENARK